MIVDRHFRELETAGRPLRVGIVGAAHPAEPSLCTSGPRSGFAWSRSEPHPRVWERAFREGWDSAVASRGDSSRGGNLDRRRCARADDDHRCSQVPCDRCDRRGDRAPSKPQPECAEAFDHASTSILVTRNWIRSLARFQAKADKAGVILTHTDGEEPGVAMTVASLPCDPSVCGPCSGNLKGMGRLL